MPVSSANRQNSTRIRNRSKSRPCSASFQYVVQIPQDLDRLEIDRVPVFHYFSVTSYFCQLASGMSLVFLPFLQHSPGYLPNSRNARSMAR